MSESNINPAYLQPGTKVGAYEVVNLVGHGGFGYLYRVSRDGTSYALKLSRWRLADMAPEDRSDTEDRLDREISALKSLRHPNIVRVHCFERWPGLDDYPYLLMDFVEGDRLNDWRQKHSPSFRTICETISGIAGAIGYMHRVGVLHRDVKSDNILVRIINGKPIPIVVDFGIARPVISRTVTRDCTTLGTDTHYAPEYAAWAMSQAFHDGDSFDWQPTTDLHSLGYVFYELVTGAAPFPRPRSGSNFTAILQTIQTFLPVKPSVRTQGRVPAVLDSIIMRLLAKEPAGRYQRGEDVIVDIRNALEKAGPEWDEPNAVATEGPEKALTRKVAPESAKRSQAPIDGRPPLTDSALSQDAAQSAVDRKAPEASAAVVDSAAATAPASDAISSRLLFPLIPKDESQAPDLSARRRIDDAVREMGNDAAGLPFKPPTTVRPSFTGIERKATSSPTPDPADVPLMATAIRQQAERLEQTGRRTRPNYIVVGGVVAGALVVVFFLVAAFVGGSPREERHSDLIAAVEKQRQVEASSNPAAPTNPGLFAKPIQIGDDLGEKPATPSPAPSQVPVAAPPSAVPATYTPPRRPGRNKEAADIDESLRKNFGRPSVPPSGTAGEQSNDPAWLRRSVRVDKASAQVAAKGLGVPLGSHIRVKLLSNLDSRTINGAPVEVMLPTPFLVGDQVILPAGTLMYGDGSSSGSRFTIRFARIRLPDNSEVEFTGLALDRGDGKAGLRASRRITSEVDTGPGLGERVAKGAASTVVGGVNVTGGLADDVAKGASTTVINNREAVVSTGENAILLDAPVLLDIFVMKSF